MDPLCHALCGAALARTRLGKMSRLAPWMLMVGANLPDVDLAWSGWHRSTTYLVHHRGFTHSVVGVAGGALLLAALFRTIERRWFPPRADDGTVAAAPPTGWWPWLLPALFGVGSHLVLDGLNTYGVRPWLPFDSTRWCADLVFIVDPWLWLLFGGVAALAGPRWRSGSLLWLVVAAGASLFLYTESRATTLARWGWGLGIAAIALLRVAGVGALRPRRVVAGGAIAAALYLGGLEASGRAALARVDRTKLGDGVAFEGSWRLAMRSPLPGDPLGWRFFFASDDWIEMVDVDLRAPKHDSWLIGPRALDDERVLALQETPEAGAWRYFARVPWAWFLEGEDGVATAVVLDDARYNRSREVYWCSIPVPISVTRVPRDSAAPR